MFAQDFGKKKEIGNREHHEKYLYKHITLTLIRTIILR